MSEEQPGMITVTERDRAVAARLMKSEGLIGFRKYQDMLAGLHDDNAVVQAFARHRRETLEEAAAVADMHDHRGDIGRAIRNLK